MFPAPSDGVSFFKLTLIDAATGQLTEIMHVTARTGDTMTIKRGQEGTTARAWSANDIAANMMTAGTLSYILGNFQPLDPTLTALAALVGVANKLPYFNGDDTAALTDLTQVGRGIIGKSTIADILTYLQLGESTFGAQNCVVFDKAGVSTWTVPDIVKKGRRVRVRVVGGGGSGGYPAINTTNPSGGGGGGGGGVSESVIDLTGISTVTITVGSGGTGQNTSASNGRQGGTSSFGKYLSATGGDGGGQISGGAGGEGMGGQINTSLGPGSPGASTIATGNSAVGGSGGGPGGNGQVLGSAENVAKGAKGPGGGGAGLATEKAGGVTGAGYSGIVIIYW